MSWYSNIGGSFELPISVDKDCDYSENLLLSLEAYLGLLKSIKNIPSRVISNVVIANDALTKSVETYYAGDIYKSQEVIYNLLEKYRNNRFFFTKLNDCYAFRGIGPFQVETEKLMTGSLSFFKARIATDTNQHFSRNEMLHIPLNNRGLVNTQRFSIAGIPCMYFSTSSYGCWLELGKPQSEVFNVSSYHLDGNMKILNLVSVWNLICGLSTGAIAKVKYSVNIDELIEDLITIWPIVCATSFRVTEKNRSFRSEYIIPQLIMLNLKKLGLDGVAFISKQVRSDTVGYPNCVNLAIPIMQSSGVFSEACKEIELSEAINFGEYQRLDDDLKYPAAKSYINDYFRWNNTALLAGSMINYGQSEFGRFDNYLISRKHEKAQLK